jgi:ADP-ribosylglycohydrolase
MRSLQELADGKRGIWDDIIWRKEGQGSGNGVIMKVSPFSVYALSSGIPQGMTELNVLNMSRLTHPDRRAGFSAIAVHTFLVEALKYGHAFDTQKVYESAIANVARYERREHLCTDTVSSHLRGVDTATIDSLIETAGVGFIAWQTAAFTLGVYRRHSQDFSSALLEAVNAGGDTDTNASIVGALVGSTVGMSGIDRKWMDIPGVDAAILVADKLCNSFFPNN